MKASRGNYDRVFKTKTQKYGANIMFLIDESGSTRYGCIQTERKTMIILAEALKNTRINTMVMGFGAKHGRDIICERVYKEFNKSPKYAIFS